MRVPLFIVLLGVSCLSFSQLAEYGQIHALVDSDTGGSRFQLPIIMISILLLCFVSHDKKDRCVALLQSRRDSSYFASLNGTS